MCGELGPGLRCRCVRARYIRLERKLRHRHHHGIQKLLPIAIFVAASVKFVAESAIKWTRGGRAALAMAMCPRENDVSAISRKFTGITRVFSPLFLFRSIPLFVPFAVYSRERYERLIFPARVIRELVGTSENR